MSLTDHLTLIATISTWLGTFASLVAVGTHLKHYIQPGLQRWVVRILWMVPVYALTAWGSLLHPRSGRYLDMLRDIYEAFVIYCFVSLLIAYMDGERAFLTVMYNRPQVQLFWPLSTFKKGLDLSDPYDYLLLKRGILQYVIVKPLTALITILCAPIGLYTEGKWSLGDLYPWVQLSYNISVSLSLYCLVIFYTATCKDLAQWRPLPKFLCIKAIVFFSYWQGFGLSILVGIGLVPSSESISAEHIASYIQAWLICIEMLPATWGHWYSFSYRDYIPAYSQAARMRLPYAVRDALGFGDVIQDVRDAYSGKQYTYHFFEPVVSVNDLDSPIPVAAPARHSKKHRAVSRQHSSLTLSSGSSTTSSSVATPEDDTTPQSSEDGNRTSHRIGIQTSSAKSSNTPARPSAKRIDENRLRAGMRYTRGGKETYWLPIDSGKGRLVASNGQLGHHSPLHAIQAIGHHRSRREREAQAIYRETLTHGPGRQVSSSYRYQYQSSTLYPIPPKLVRVRQTNDGSGNYEPISDDECSDEELYKLDFEYDALGDSYDEQIFNEARNVEGDYHYPVVEVGIAFGFGRRGSYQPRPSPSLQQDQSHTGSYVASISQNTSLENRHGSTSYGSIV